MVWRHVNGLWHMRVIYTVWQCGGFARFKAVSIYYVDVWDCLYDFLSNIGCQIAVAVIKVWGDVVYC